MQRKKIFLFTAVLGSLIGGSPSLAHRGRASYTNETITLQAIVTEFRFINPHVQIYFNIRNETGETEAWQGELTAPNKFARGGWTKQTLLPGDGIVITGSAGRNGGHSVAINEIVMSDGTLIPL